MKSLTDLLPKVSMTDAGGGGRKVPNTGCVYTGGGDGGGGGWGTSSSRAAETSSLPVAAPAHVSEQPRQ
jgi:hypothetical protein